MSLREYLINNGLVLTETLVEGGIETVVSFNLTGKVIYRTVSREGLSEEYIMRIIKWILRDIKLDILF